jgi:PKD repeat protein
MMKRLTLSLVALSYALMTTAQSDQPWVEMMQDPNANFYDVQATFEAYWSDKNIEKGKGYKQFKRWEAFMEPRVYPSGERPSPAVLYEAYQYANKTFTSSSGMWQPLGPFNGNAIDGIGRVNRLAFHPTNNQIIFACTAAGGLWKTIDGGNNWTTATDLLPNLGSSDLVIHPQDPNIMYLATGDRDGGDTYSFGVLKSTNGGQSWQATGLVHNVANSVRVSDLYMHPDHPDTLIASSRSGIYRTTNGGDSWTLVQGGVFNEIVQKPGDPNILMVSTIASGGSRIYRSTNNGLSWAQVSNGNLPTSGVSRIELAVTPADPNYVYALMGANNNGFYGLYRSTDAGLTWTQRSNSPNLMGWSTTGSDQGGQAWYDLALAVDPANKERVYTGGVNIWTSSNGGTSWTLAAHWYGGGGAPFVHADIHDLEYSNNGQLWTGCDGGIYSKSESSNDWDSHNDGLNITQYYKIGSAANDTTRVIAGAQDNGTHLMRAGQNWIKVRGGDGMDCAISSKNSNVMYSSVYYGDFRKSTNGGGSFNAPFNLAPAGSGNWVTPLALDPKHPDTIYAGFSRVWRSYNGGGSFSAVSPSTLTGGANIDHMTIAPNHTNVLYIAVDDKLWRSDDRGVNWVNLSGRVPGNAAISHIAVSHLNPLHVAISRSGYSNAQKLYTSTDGGLSWKNLSGSLPNIPANCVTYVEDNSGGMYVGTDVGVYYRDKNMYDWVPFNDGLPNVIVNELEINYLNKKIRAGTYGRGLYESKLFGEDLAPIASFTLPATSCIGDTIQLTDFSSYNPTQWNWTITPATFTYVNGTDGQSQHPQIVINQAGIYNVSLTASNTYGSSNSTQISATSVGGKALPYMEDFETTAGWEEWSKPASSIASKRFFLGTVAGNGGVRAPGVNFVNSNSTGDRVEIVSPQLNLQNHNSIWLAFDYAYTSYQTNNDDSLKVYISGACNNTWTLLGAYGEDGNNTFVTRSPQAAAFTPNQASDWCGNPGYATCKLIDISAYAGLESVRIKFVAVDGGGNSIFIDNINVYGTSNLAPVANFSAPQQVCAQRPLQFADQSYGSPSSYSWTFAGGTPATSSARNPTVTYNTSGTYAVKLKISNALGADSIEKLSYVTVDAANTVTVDISPVNTNTHCPGDTFHVSATSVNEGLSPLYDWYVNGNLVATTTQGQYAFPGLKNGDEVYAILASSESCAFPIQAYSDTVVANYYLPVNISFSSPTITCTTESAFALTASPSGGNFSGAGVSGGQFDPSAVGPGQYTISYAYTDGNGCASTATQSITVNSPPSINFNMRNLCINAGNVLLNMAQPFGGTYSGNGVVNGYLDVASLGLGTHQLTYTYTSAGCSPVSETVTYTINPQPARPNIILRNDSMVCNAVGAASYQWYSTSSIIPGATQASFKPTSSFTYYAVITDANGCTATSDTFQFNVGLNDNDAVQLLELYPNPAKAYITLNLVLEGAKDLDISITSVTGALVKQKALGTNQQFEERINLNGLAPGMYILSIEGDGLNLSRKFTVE